MRPEARKMLGGGEEFNPDANILSCRGTRSMASCVRATDCARQVQAGTLIVPRLSDAWPTQSVSAYIISGDPCRTVDRDQCRRHAGKPGFAGGEQKDAERVAGRHHEH